MGQLRLMLTAVALLGLVHLSPATGATALQALELSPDITLSLGAVTVQDENVSLDQGGTISLVSLGTLPANADVDAYHRLANGDQWFSLDVTVSLGGLTVEPADVVLHHGTGYSLVFDASAHGVPGGVNVDAVTASGSELLLSFDTSVKLGNLTADDEDLVRFDGTSFSLELDGSAAGVPTALDLDGAQNLGGGHYLLSFDGSGVVGSVSFDDEDILEYNRTGSTWELAYDASKAHAQWAGADLDAFHVTVGPTVSTYDGPVVVSILVLLAGVLTLRAIRSRRRLGSGKG